MRRSEEARKHIPSHLKLVELGGWTLGGLYLARYSDSPAGVFDELVVLAGLVWNAPTSCAWASRVYVNNKAARDHGIKVVGLPSRLASFEQSREPTRAVAAPATFPGAVNANKPQELKPSWWNVDYAPHQSGSTSCALTIFNKEKGGKGMKEPVAELFLPPKHSGKPGIPMQMSLPSFSGCTAAVPDMLSYTCKLDTHLRFVPRIENRIADRADGQKALPEDMSTILTGKPLITMSFDNMTMTVPHPQRCLP